MLTEQLLLLQVTDDASLKAGKTLANRSKWVNVFSHEEALWGYCQGSGSNPYFTQIDLNNLAFKCSCPSRKFPCKHGVALAYLFLNEKNIFTESIEIEENTKQWLDKRGTRKKVQIAESQDVKNEKIDAAKAKRADTRVRQVEGGTSELRQWLQDIVRSGITTSPANSIRFNENIIARMVDAKAGGLAAALRNLNDINYFEEGWQVEFMRQISRLYLLLEAFEKMDFLDEKLQQDIRSLIGWQTKKEDVLSTESIGDQWVVLSRRVEEEDKGLQSERVWLWGTRSNRPALILNFFGGYGPPLTVTHDAGTTVIGDLCFYPSTFPLRALFAVQNETAHFQSVSGFSNIENFKNSYHSLLSRYPFLESVPTVISNVFLYKNEKNWYIVDEQKHYLLLQNIDDQLYPILSFSGAKPIQIFALYQNNQLQLLSCWNGKKFVEV